MGPAPTPEEPPAAPPAAPEAPKPAAKPTADDDPTLVVIEPGGTGLEAGSLGDAGRAERRRRSEAGAPVAVINDKTLPKYTSGRVTTGAAPAPKSASASEAERAAAEEAYWRGRMRDLRTAWRRAAEAVPVLEREAEQLRVRFYAEDDPYVRDGRIKPAWDLTLENLRRTREEAARLEGEVAVALEEGRFRGALPGWLREAEDLEPAAPPPARRLVGEPRVLEGAQSIEPPVVGEDPPAGR
jgi:hypothetical protein